MSFSFDVKDEISKKIINDCCKKSFMQSFLLLVKKKQPLNSKEPLIFVIKSLPIARTIIKLFKEVFPNIEIEFSLYKSKTKNLSFVKCRVYKGIDILLNQISINNRVDVVEFPKHDQALEEDFNECDRAFYSGAFVACGSVNSPKTSNYHIEFSFDNETTTDNFIKAIATFNIDFIFKKLIRKNRYGAYLKTSAHITDFLVFMSATDNMLLFESDRMDRSFKNALNRYNNLDISNQMKINASSLKQINMINFLEKKRPFSWFKWKCSKSS
ncbi:DNA-binding protein WhiA [Spiroplasma endosymbiont of Anurida maritima]|uniref:DNA-binding protein WhiA n=1 Tax=Spiroplasma endosymbiont of Anurida maritima TaxID=2967972 RepID=UPI0036D22350